MKMNANLWGIIGVELLCAAQGVEFRAPIKTSAALQNVLKCLRASVATLKEDRYLAPDIETAMILVSGHSLVEAAGRSLNLTLVSAP